jgi:DNA-binding Lrp family transcriptional regulator
MKNEWLNLLSSAVRHKPDKIPDGWKTLAQLSEELGKPYDTLRRKIRILEKEGRVQRKEFRVHDRSGRVVSMPHWKI